MNGADSTSATETATAKTNRDARRRGGESMG
jgi:hypothetical protein